MRVSGAAAGHGALRTAGHEETSGRVRRGQSFGSHHRVAGQAPSVEERAAYTSGRAGSPGEEQRAAQLRQGSGSSGGTRVGSREPRPQPPPPRGRHASAPRRPEAGGAREQGRPRAELPGRPGAAAAGAMLKPKDLCPRAGTRTFLEAMQAGKVHLARFVLDALDRSIIDCRAEQGRTPLMVAVGLPDPALRSRFVRLLLEQGAAVNLRDERGRTALSLACERGHLDAVQLLVQFSGDPEAADAAGNSPVMWAAACGHGAVLEFLVRSFRRLGLRLDRTNRAGLTALQLAAARGHGTCVQALTGPWGRAAAAAAARGSNSDSPPARPPPAPSPERRRPSPRRLPRPLLARFARAAGGHGHGGEAGSGGKSSGRHRAQGSERPELGRSMSLALGAVTEEEAARLRAGALMARPHSPQSSGTGRWRSHEVLEGAPPPALAQAPIGLSPHPEGGPGSGRLGLRRRSTAPDIPSLVGEAPGPESGPELEANAVPHSTPGPQPWQAGTEEAVALHDQR